MISAPDNSPVRPPRKGLSLRAWIVGCVLLVLLTWAPVIALHLRNMSVTDPGTGTLVVVFPATMSNRDLFRSITEARGAPVGPVSWAPSTWIVQSTESGFAGRLRERGAWAVYSPSLLSARQMLSCTGMVKAAPSSVPAGPRPAS